MSCLSAKKRSSLGASLSDISQPICVRQFGIAQRRLAGIILAGLIFVGVSTPALSQQNWEDCKGGILPAGSLTSPQDLRINGVACIVDGHGTIDGITGTYVYRNVNIYNGGSLTFEDKQIDFHAHSILVEKDGILQASGTSGLKGPLTIWLWGSNDLSNSITCLSDSKNQCGVPDTVWNSNPNLINHNMAGMSCNQVTDPYVPDGCFYQYDVADNGAPTGAYFGNKVLAVSYGGTLILTGSKGIRTGTIEDKPADSGTSWVRLNQTLNGGGSKGGGETSFYVDRPVSTWGNGDHIVVTATDYLPGHTEEFVISGVDATGTKISIDTTQPAPMNAVQYPHWGEGYDYSSLVVKNNPEDPTVGPIEDPNLKGISTLPPNQIETRAIVALLSRSIRIASEGATPVLPRVPDSSHFPADEGNFYGGHTIVRQGFKSYQVQGVEFYQLGQGGAIGRYPVHFHMARSVPQPNSTTDERGTFVADSSIVDSMTRFVTVHATQGVTLARNVGYKSIGHGFYLEDATEVRNRLYSNVGITVRAGLSGVPSNPRKVPGILNTVGPQGNGIPDDFPLHSDVNNPTTFWITNTWNDFEYNAAVGAETCGACYWLPPSGISGPSRYEAWNGYAGMQKMQGLWGATPMLKFIGNSCSTAMSSLQTVSTTNACNGLLFGDGQSSDAKLYSVPNPNAPPQDQFLMVTGQRAKTTICSDLNGDCSDTAKACAGTFTSDPMGKGPDLKYCLPFVLDHYTTSFNWAQTNFAAIWLRGWWFLLENSAITDVQNGGLTLVSGGGYTRSDVAQGFWSVFKNSILVGNTQPLLNNTAPIGNNGFPANVAASPFGPFNPSPKGLPCPYTPTGASFCASAANGITFQNQTFANSQRLFSIYDGPATEYNNIYSDIHVTQIGTVADCAGGNCQNTNYMGGNVQGVLQFPPTGDSKNGCYLPNAAIAWKQPNGFYYPPAFNSDNLVFNTAPGHKVDIRHFVIQPQYNPNSFFKDNFGAIQKIYCSWAPNMFSGNSFTDIDRETELTDDDGSLTGLLADIPNQLPSRGRTISVNKDPFFNAPLVTDECASGQLTNPIASGADSGATVNTSPYEHLSTAIVADCAKEIGSTCNGNWSGPAIPNAPGGGCANVTCYGVPLYRQYKAASDEANAKPSIFMMGQGNAQRSTMTANGGKYYIDTTQSQGAQMAAGATLFSVFQPNTSYEIFLLFGSDKTHQTYQMYIGTGLSMQDAQAAIKPGRMQITTQSYPFCSGDSNDPAACQTACGSQCTGSWATVTAYDKDLGLLTVDIDLTKQADMQVSSREAFCQPTTYCQWNSAQNTCGCKPGTDCDDSKVCSFATKDIDCPIGGCYGFRITMPGAFANPLPAKGLPPAPTDFPADNTSFAAASSETAGDCYYDNHVPKPPTLPKKRRTFEPLSTEPINWEKP